MALRLRRLLLLPLPVLLQTGVFWERSIKWYAEGSKQPLTVASTTATGQEILRPPLSENQNSNSERRDVVFHSPPSPETTTLGKPIGQKPITTLVPAHAP